MPLLKILCDENIPDAVIASLEKWGCNVARVKPGTADIDIGAWAKREEFIILTFDSDFANILSFPPGEFFGIIRIKIDPPLFDIVIKSLKRVFNVFTTLKEFKGKLIIAEAWTFRVWEERPDSLDSDEVIRID